MSASTSTTSSAILILFDLDNAPIPSQLPVRAVVSVLAQKITDLVLLSDDGGCSLSNAAASNFIIRAAAFANEATVRTRPDLAASLSSAGVSLVTVPATRNAADAMVVSCAAEALHSDGGDEGSSSGGLSGLVFCSADNYFSGFLRYASYKGVRTFVAGDFDNNNNNNNNNNNRARGKGGAGGQRLRKSTGPSSRSSSDDDELDANAKEEQRKVAPWRRKELPAAADGSALWRDVLNEARELLNN